MRKIWMVYGEIQNIGSSFCTMVNNMTAIQNRKQLLMAILSAVILFMISATPLVAEEKSNITVIVEEISFESDKKTRPEALAREVKLEAGTGFESMNYLQDRLDREVQDLLNLRVFADVTVRVEDLPSGIGEPRRVRVVFTVVDTWTLFPFLVPSSDGSTTVFNLAVVDKNFLGTLTEFRISGDLGIGTDPIDGKWEISRWGIYFIWSGFTVNQWQFSTRLSQTYQTERKFDDTILLQDYSYYETLLLFDVRYEFKRVPKLFTYITPMVGLRYKYETKVQVEAIEYEYSRTGLSLGLDYNRIDWIDFYRRGWAMGLINATWGSFDGENGNLKSIFTSRMSAHKILAGINPNARLLGTMSINHEMTSLGSLIRGVRDNNVYGNRALVLNSGIQILLWRGKVIEPHLQPFVDIGIAAKRNEPLDWTNDFFLGVGSELIVFLPTLPSAQVRGWIGFDLSMDQWSKAKWEAGLSFDLHY